MIRRVDRHLAERNCCTMFELYRFEVFVAVIVVVIVVVAVGATVVLGRDVRIL